MNAFQGLIRKDLQLFLRDRRAVIMSFAAPILIGSFFGYVFGGNGGGQPQGRMKVLIVDQEKGSVSQGMVRRLSDEKTLEVVPSSLEAARQSVQKGNVSVALVIPPDFGKQATAALFTGIAKPHIDLLFDPSRRMEAQMLKGMATGAAMQSVSQEAFAGATGRDFVDKQLQQLSTAKNFDPTLAKNLTDVLKSVQRLNQTNNSQGQAAGLQIPFDTTEQALTASPGVNYNGYAHSFAGMAIQFMLFMGIDVGIGLLLLRRRGLWSRFRAAPISKFSLLLSRAVSAMLIGISILFVVFTFARLVFGVRVQGSLPGLVAVCAAFSLMTACYGLLIAALGKTPEAARGLSVLATLLLVMLSGAWVPSFLFPNWLQSLAKLLPTRWAMDGMDAMIWRGQPASSAISPVLVLLGASALFGALALWRFRWREE